MPKIFDENQLEFIDKSGRTRSGDNWIKLLEKLVDYLNDSRTIPIRETEPDYESALGRALLARRLAAKVIEEELIDLLKQARNIENKPVSQPGPGGTYR